MISDPMNGGTLGPPPTLGLETVLTSRRKRTPTWSLLPGIASALLTGIGIATVIDLDVSQTEVMALSVFIVPLGIAVAVIFGLPYLLQSWLPSMAVAVDNTRPDFGATINIVYQLTGNLERVRCLTISLEQAVCTYEIHESPLSGKEQRLPKRERPILKVPILETSDEMAMAFGKLTVSIPSSEVARVELTSRDESIEWWIRVRADMKLLPNGDERFPLQVGQDLGQSQ